MQDQENRPYRPDDSDHPAIVRLQAELDAARDGIGVLGELEADRRERVVAELLSAVPDVASRAAYEVGADRAVATIRRFEERRAVDHESAPALWDRLVLTAFEAAAAAEPTERDPASARRGATAAPVGAVSDARA